MNFKKKYLKYKFKYLELKKQIGGAEFSEDMIEKIKNDKDIKKLITKRCSNCRGATMVLIAKLKELDVDDKYIAWGEWSGHSVAIVTIHEIKDGPMLTNKYGKKYIDLTDPPANIDNYYVFDGSFHQILKGYIKDEDNLFIGKLKDYYNNYYSKSWREDTELSILPLEDNHDWIIEDDYSWIIN
jgi:hypothetical protein